MATEIASLLGKTFELDSIIGTNTIQWKQGAFMGMGGDRSQTYKQCHYKLDGKIIVVFVQSDRDIPKPLVLDQSIQCGYCEKYGEIFFVLHDKEQTPSQYRYQIGSVGQERSYTHQVLKAEKGYNASKISDEWLKDLK